MTLPTGWKLVFAALVALVCISLQPAGHAAAIDTPAPPSSPIAATALKYLGSYQGQCWGFAKKVVAEATGRRIGFDYRQGFFEGGAVEVSVKDAHPGDVIQYTDDSFTAPWADYPGLHTAIVLQRSEDSMSVIDANSFWDGIVRIRTGYDPAEQARIKGLSFHIYRFPGGDGPSPVDGSGVPATAAGFTSGVHATVNTPYDCLNLRESASRAAAIVYCLPDGAQVTVSQEDALQADDRTWVHVETLWGTGWVAADYLAANSADEPSTES